MRPQSQCTWSALVLLKCATSNALLDDQGACLLLTFQAQFWMVFSTIQNYSHLHLREESWLRPKVLLASQGMCGMLDWKSSILEHHILIPPSNATLRFSSVALAWQCFFSPHGYIQTLVVSWAHGRDSSNLLVVSSSSISFLLFGAVRFSMSLTISKLLMIF